jgi:hypothetical protein
MALGLLAAPALGWSQGKNALVGTWQLVSAVNTDDKGVTKVGSFGPTPLGRIVFTEGGHYVSVNTAPDLPRYENRMKASAAEYEGTVKKSTAAFGTYQLAPDGKSVTMQQEAGTFAIRNGKQEKRELMIQGDEMRYWTNATYGGRSELVFKRLR